MKALEILNNLKINIPLGISKTDYQVYWNSKINEAIAEIEALNNRSCESCNCYENKARCDECSVNFDNLWESKC